MSRTIRDMRSHVNELIRLGFEYKGERGRNHLAQEFDRHLGQMINLLFDMDEYVGAMPITVKPVKFKKLQETRTLPDNVIEMKRIAR